MVFNGAPAWWWLHPQNKKKEKKKANNLLSIWRVFDFPSEKASLLTVVKVICDERSVHLNVTEVCVSGFYTERWLGRPDFLLLFIQCCWLVAILREVLRGGSPKHCSWSWSVHSRNDTKHDSVVEFPVPFDQNISWLCVDALLQEMRRWPAHSLSRVGLSGNHEHHHCDSLFVSALFIYSFG